jgi:hypothetical protein
MPKPNFETAMETKLLAKRLLQAAPGGTVSYADLSREVGYAVTGADSHLQSALRQCLSQENAVFDNIRGEGYRRLTDEEIVSASSRDAERLRRGARRAIVKLSSVKDFSAMPPEKRLEHNARLSLFAVMRAMAKESAVKTITPHVQVANNQLPLAKTLEAFMRKTSASS